MRVSELRYLVLDGGIAAMVLSRWSLTEVEADLSPKQAEEIRAMKAELYRNTVTEIAGFLKGEGYIVFPGELSLPCERSVPAPVNG